MVYLRDGVSVGTQCCVCALSLMPWVSMYVIVCLFLWGGFNLFLNPKELTADGRQDGLTVFIQSYVRTLEEIGST